MAHDARIAQQSLHITPAEACDLGEVEAGEGGPEVVALAQDREPREARLESLEADLLEQPMIVDHRTPPLAVVVGHVVGRAAAPEAALAPALVGDKAGGWDRHAES